MKMDQNREGYSRRIRLKIAYDGTNYVGWQIQKNGISIQQKINEAVSDLFGTPIEVTGASRTDAGVHALGNVAAFDVVTGMSPDKISYALNTRLPGDIVVVASDEVSPDFHPRFDALKKTYEYHILNRPFSDPLRRFNCYFYHHHLDVEKMKAACAPLVGEHDFTSFASIHSQTKSFVRTIYQLSVRREDDEIIIRITGNGFLYNMVPIIAGTLIQMGAGLKDPNEMPDILYGCDRGLSGPTAPARGLVLVEICYEA